MEDLLPPIYLLNVRSKGTGVSGNVFLGDCAIVDFPEEIVGSVRTDARLKLSESAEMTSVMMRLVAFKIVTVHIEISIVTTFKEFKTILYVVVIKLIPAMLTIPKTDLSNANDASLSINIEIHTLIVKIIVIELIHLFSERVIVNVGREVVKFPVFE